MGICPIAKELQGFWITLDPSRDYLPVCDRIKFLERPEHAISNISLYGDGIAEFHAAIEKRIDGAKSGNDIMIAPFDGLDEILRSGKISTVGGELHGGVVTPTGFAYRTYHRIEKRTKGGGILYTSSFLNIEQSNPPKFGDFLFIPHPFIEYTWQDSDK